MSRVILSSFRESVNGLVECPAMLIGFPHSRFLATLLPLSLLWVVVACVELCERESFHNATERVVSVDVNSIEGASDCDGCPLDFFPKAISPEQTRLVINLSAALSSSAITVQPVHSDSAVLSDRHHRVLYAVSPPLELLSTLRI